MKKDLTLMKSFLTLLLQAFDFLSLCGIVHSDAKTDNILVDYDGERITDLKLIDFGSAFIFDETTSLNVSTPEYLPPEIL